MEIKKGTKLEIKSVRKGTYKAIALKDFDTEKNKWYPVATLEFVAGTSREFDGWEVGEEIPCRASLCKVALLSE